MSSAKMSALMCRSQCDKRHGEGRKEYVRYLSIQSYFTVVCCGLRSEVRGVIPLWGFQGQEGCRLIGGHVVAVNL